MTRLHILATWPAPEEALDRLRRNADVQVLPKGARIEATLEGVDILLALPTDPLGGAVLRAGKALKLVASIGTGYDNIDVAAAKALGIAVSNAPGALTETTADLAFAMMLSVARGLSAAERALRSGQFGGWSPSSFLGADVWGKTLGIVGMGRIGQAVACRAAGFSMPVLYSGPSQKPAVDRTLGARYVPLTELLEQSDFVSLHTPLTPKTRHLISAGALSRMKPTAYLINTARGAVVDEAALGEALHAGKLAGAALDVFEAEPRVHPQVLSHPGSLVLPHIGSATPETRRRMASRAVDNILAYVAGKPLLDAVVYPPS